jgi:EAL domain-containing protein (putative c-di-GMP-specific phosphodiesterase class I)
MDVEMPNGGGAGAARTISQVLPAIRIVAISSHEDRKHVDLMVDAGACGYIVKGASPQRVLDTIKRCAHGESIFTAQTASALVSSDATTNSPTNSQRLQTVSRTAVLQSACRPEAIDTVFQPIVDLHSGELIALEALSRFRGAFGFDTGAMFVEAIELGMAAELELAALRVAIDTVNQHEGKFARVALNVSPDTLLDPELRRVLSAIDPETIVLEITEHERFADYENIRAALSELTLRGVRVAVDDTGASLASLRHILALMPNTIKLDRSIVSKIDVDRGRRALAKGLITFAHEIGATVVAEGIETPGELECVVELGAEYGQGYFIARPGPLETVFDFKWRG